MLERLNTEPSGLRGKPAAQTVRFLSASDALNPDSFRISGNQVSKYKKRPKIDQNCYLSIEIGIAELKLRNRNQINPAEWITKHDITV